MLGMISGVGFLSVAVLSFYLSRQYGKGRNVHTGWYILGWCCALIVLLIIGIFITLGSEAWV